jgi:hypothetical protein
VRHWLIPLATALAILISSKDRARAIDLTHEMAQMYASVGAPPPTRTQMTVCYGFVCRLRTTLYFTPGDRAALGGVLARGRASPAAERKAVAEAVRWFDRRVGRLIGTSKRVARADFRAGNDDGNFDCFDTTRNTVSLLLVLNEWKLLRHHRVADPRFRGNILVGQTPHNTAVLTERKSGQNWVVDMWTTAYGQLPEVMPFDKWTTLN